MADNAKKRERITLYHYTNRAGARGIMTSGVINQSTGPRDAAFGPGVYATTLPPSSSKCAIAENNYDNRMSKSFVEGLVRAG